MKKTLLLMLTVIAMLLPLSANAFSPVQLDLGLGWSSTLNGYSSNYYSKTEAQGPHFMVGVKFRVAERFLLGVDASLAVQPWSYGSEYSYDYGPEYNNGYSYSYDVSVKNRLFVSGDLTLTYHVVFPFYIMIGGGVTGMNSSYEAGYSKDAGVYGDKYDSMDGMEVGWNGLLAVGFQFPLAPFFRLGMELRYTGGYITSGPELFDFSTFSLNFLMSFL